MAFALAVPVFGVDLVIWDYVRGVLDYQQFAEEYMRLHPDVNIEVTWAQAEYVSKIQVGMVTGTAPSAFAHHPQDSAAGCWRAPTTCSRPMSWCRRCSATTLARRRSIRVPAGLQGAVLFINQDLWDNAGLGAPPLMARSCGHAGATRRSTGY